MLRPSFLAAATAVALPLLLPIQAEALPVITVTGSLVLLDLGSGTGGGYQNSSSIAFDHGSIDFSNPDYPIQPSAGLYSGSASFAKSPFGSGVADYLVAQGKNSNKGPVLDTVTLAFTGEQTSFGLLWGTIDTYNELDFYHGSTLTDTVTGGELAAFGVAVDGSQSAYVKIEGLGPFDRVVAVDHDRPAFEFVPDPVPEPSGIALLSLGLAALGAIRAARKRGAGTSSSPR
jgi:hypothetical protein